MTSVNISSIGQKLYINLDQDISAGTDYKIEIEPRVGEKKEEAATLGTSDQAVGDSTYLANEYVYFTLTAGYFDKAGNVRMKAVVTMPTETLSTDYELFRVMP
jgi:hypothetical protein